MNRAIYIELVDVYLGRFGACYIHLAAEMLASVPQLQQSCAHANQCWDYKLALIAIMS